MDSVACSKQVPTSYLEMSTWPCWRTGRQFDTLGTAVDNLKSQRIRIDEPGGDDQEMDADELDEDAFLEDEDSLCWKHLTVKGCADGSCPFIHMDLQWHGWVLHAYGPRVVLEIRRRRARRHAESHCRDGSKAERNKEENKKNWMRPP